MKGRRSKRIDAAERTRARQTGASVRKLRREQRAAEAQEKSAAGSRKCACGCGAEVTRRFKQGHDMRMRPGSQWLKQHPELAGEARRRV